MTPEFLLSKFDLLAETPFAIPALRQIVLHMATSGRLVPQDAADEPARKLVIRIERHLAGLRATGKRRGDAVEPLDEAAMPELPGGWQWVRLGNVVGYGSPNKQESADIAPDAWLLDLEDVEKDTSRLLRRKTYAEAPSKSTKTEFRRGDVLYGKLRPYLNKVLVADGPGYCTTEIVPISTFGFIDPHYLCYALRRPAFIQYAVSKSYGMNLPRLSTTDAQLAPLPLPPLDEQKRIVAKVDDLMALCDRLEAQQQQREHAHAALTHAALARFAEAPTTDSLEYLAHPSYTIAPPELRMAILAAAVRGRLLPQQASDRLAFTELNRCRKELGRSEWCPPEGRSRS